MLSGGYGKPKSCLWPEFWWNFLILYLLKGYGMMTFIKEDEDCFIANLCKKPQKPEALFPSFPQRYLLLEQCGCILSLYHLKNMPWTAYSALGTSFPLTGLSVLLLNQDSAKTNCNGDGRGRCGDWGRVWFTLVYCGPRMSLLLWLRANANTGEKERVTSLPLFPFIPQAPSLAYFKKKFYW